MEYFVLCWETQHCSTRIWGLLLRRKLSLKNKILEFNTKVASQGSFSLIRDARMCSGKNGHVQDSSKDTLRRELAGACQQYLLWLAQPSGGRVKALTSTVDQQYSTVGVQLHPKQDLSWKFVLTVFVTEKSTKAPCVHSLWEEFPKSCASILQNSVQLGSGMEC